MPYRDAQGRMRRDDGSLIENVNDTSEVVNNFLGAGFSKQLPSEGAMTANRALNVGKSAGTGTGLYDSLAPAVNGDPYGPRAGETAQQYEARVGNNISMATKAIPGETPESWRARNRAAVAGQTQPQPVMAQPQGVPAGGAVPPPDLTDVVTGDNSTQGIVDNVSAIIGGANVSRSPEDEARIREALATQKGLIDQILASPSAARLTAQQVMAEQRAQAISARGGAAATQQAQSQAANNVTGIQSQAASQAIDEQARKYGLAAQVAGQMGELATSSERNALDVGKSNQQASVQLAGMVSELGMGELQLDQKDRENLGQIMRDLHMFSQTNALDWAKLGYEDKWKMLDNMLGYYTVNEQTKTQLQAIRMQKGKDFWDKFGIFGQAVGNIGGTAAKAGAGGG